MKTEDRFITYTALYPNGIVLLKLHDNDARFADTVEYGKQTTLC